MLRDSDDVRRTTKGETDRTERAQNGRHRNAWILLNRSGFFGGCLRGNPELAREWFERAQRSWRRANDPRRGWPRTIVRACPEEKWEALKDTIHRSLRALLAARGGCTRPPSELERLWVEAAAADEAMPGADIGNLRQLVERWSLLAWPDEGEAGELWRRLSEATCALLDHAEARIRAVSAVTEPRPRPPVDPDRAVAEWSPTERKCSPSSSRPCGPATPRSCRT